MFFDYDDESGREIERLKSHNLIKFLANIEIIKVEELYIFMEWNGSFAKRQPLRKHFPQTRIALIF